MEDDLVALVTNGGDGLGYAIASAIAEQYRERVHLILAGGQRKPKDGRQGLDKAKAVLQQRFDADVALVPGSLDQPATYTGIEAALHSLGRLDVLVLRTTSSVPVPLSATKDRAKAVLHRFTSHAVPPVIFHELFHDYSSNAKRPRRLDILSDSLLYEPADAVLAQAHAAHERTSLLAVAQSKGKVRSARLYLGALEGEARTGPLLKAASVAEEGLRMLTFLSEPTDRFMRATASGTIKVAAANVDYNRCRFADTSFSTDRLFAEHAEATASLSRGLHQWLSTASG